MARLALALGKSMEWVSELDAGEFMAWQMVDQIHPFGDKRADMRAGIIADTTRATRGVDPLGPLAYILGRVGPEEDPQDVTDDDVAELFGFDFGESQ